MIFKGQNFTVWLRRIKAKLLVAGVADTILSANSGKQDEKNKAFDIVISHISSEILEIISGETAYDLIQQLKKRFEKSDITTRVNARTKLAALKLTSFKTGEEYVDAVQKLINEIKNTGGKIEEEEQVTWLLNGLPPTLLHIRSSVLAMDQVSAEKVKHIIEDNTSILPVVKSEIKPSAMQVSQSQKCKRCHRKNHTTEKCFATTSETRRTRHIDICYHNTRNAI